MIRIKDIVSAFFSCKIATDTHHTEPAKMAALPERPWETVEAGFCGPFPNKEYVIVVTVTDQYSRYPEVESLKQCKSSQSGKSWRKSSQHMRSRRQCSPTMAHHLTQRSSKNLQQRWDSTTRWQHLHIQKARWKVLTSSLTKQQPFHIRRDWEATGILRYTTPSNQKDTLWVNIFDDQRSANKTWVLPILSTTRGQRA